MPELPEIATLAHQLNQRLPGKRIAAIDILQPKCLNLPPEEFSAALQDAEIDSAAYHGKWIQVDTSRGWLLLNLGMGGELLVVERGELPEKRRVVFDLQRRRLPGGQLLVVWLHPLCPAGRAAPAPDDRQAGPQRPGCDPRRIQPPGRRAARAGEGFPPRPEQNRRHRQLLRPGYPLDGLPAPAAPAQHPFSRRRSPGCTRRFRTACAPAWRRAAPSTRWIPTASKAASVWRISRWGIKRASLARCARPRLKSSRPAAPPASSARCASRSSRPR